MRKLFSVLFMMSAILFASCGQSHSAKGRVEEFMKNGMGLTDYNVIAWSNIDSTFRVTDSMLTVMRQNAVKDKLVKGSQAYVNRTNKLNMITVTYSVGKDTLQSTFYLDDKLQGVVGVKKDIFNIER